MEKFKPLGNRILIKLYEEQKDESLAMKGKIILLNEEKNPVYEVIALGTGEQMVNIWDIIMIEKYYGQAVEIGGVEYLILPTDKILGVFSNG